MSTNFISYNRNQMFLLPLSSDEFVPPLHLARVIEAIIDEPRFTGSTSTIEE
ncbi:MAG: hypothetical protein KKB77_01655 [Bacteroidetes bacterium]|nr:hypothetical protein [Bacteroidota bacterium]